MAARKIIIDTDPGQDDAVAILLAFASPELEVLGLTTVAGNAPLALTTRNALKICELAGRTQTPVHAGAAGPLLRRLMTAEEVHGPTGLDGPDLPEPAMLARGLHAVDFIVETLRAEPPGAVTLCTLGPLTNIAMAFAKAPDVVARVREIVAMGGGWSEGGNVTPAAEFNIHVDPHAAQAVFHAGVPLTLHPLDVTHKCLTSAERVDAFRRLGTRPSVAVADLLDFFERYDVRKYGVGRGPLHDPNVIAWLIAPELYEGWDVNVEVECASELAMGQTVVDWWGVTNRPANVHFVREIDDAGFFRLLVERIGRL
jgi:purine nucleosidase